ncbi:MAG TPA: hypothetical protein VMS73_06415 [Anaerolineaceae bacterium]|nr:hypothetical protein [Anaerolineaceae bacterium]
MDSALLLTRGNPAGFTANLGRLHPARGFYTGVTTGSKDNPPLIGQVIYRLGNRSARLSFIAPNAICDSPDLPGLLEGLAWHAGEWGAFHVLGELEEICPAFDSMRRAGFSVYAWQRVWQLPFQAASSKTNGQPRLPAPYRPGSDGGSPHEAVWQPVREEDDWAVRNLFQNLVPPLAQSAEPLSVRRQRGLIYRQGSEIMAYVEGVFGPRGIYLYPLIHPDIEDVGSLISALPPSLAPLLGRPVYMAVRSYQAWMETTLTELGARSTPRQALMVKHMTQAQRVPLSARLVQIEGRQIEPAKTVAQNSIHSSQ